MTEIFDQIIQDTDLIIICVLVVVGLITVAWLVMSFVRDMRDRNNDSDEPEAL